MPAMTNEAFRGVVDSFLSKLTPEQLAVVRRFQQSGDNISDKPAAYEALKGLGYDQKLTDELLNMAYWVYSQPNRQYGGNYTPDQFSALFGDYDARNSQQRNAEQAARDADFAEKKKADDLAAELDAFARELMGPLDMADPTTRAIIDDVTAKVSRGVGRSGVEGGMANAAVGRGVGDAALQLHDQRRQYGASVMGQRLGDQRQLNMMRDQANRMKLNDEYMNKLSGWESQRGFGQQLGGVFGSIGGGLLGFLAGGPMGAAAGASAGYGVGSGLGGSAYGGPPSAPVYNSPYYGGGSGGMSGYNRGGW